MQVLVEFEIVYVPSRFTFTTGTHFGTHITAQAVF